MTSARRRNTPLWREFEKLVLRIEQAILPDNAAVRSPDRIPSLLTGRKREVDASIRTKIGTTELVITIECRKRQAKQDVTWLEQLHSKKQALGIAKTIAVSSSPFSTDSIQAASHYGIDLRVMSEFTADDIKNGIFPRSVIHLYKRADLLSPPLVEYDAIVIGAESDMAEPSAEAARRSGLLDDPVFVVAHAATPISINDIWLRVEHQLNPFAKVPTDGSILRTKFNLSPEDLEIQTGNGLRPVRRITYDVALSWQEEVLPLEEAGAVKYDDARFPSTPTIARVEFESAKASLNNIRFSFQCQSGSEEIRLGMELLPNQTPDS